MVFSWILLLHRFLVLRSLTCRFLLLSFVLLVSNANESLPRSVSSSRLPTVSSGSFTVSGLAFKSLTRFKLIFVSGVTHGSHITLLHVAVQFSRHLCLKRLAYPLGVLGVLVRARLTGSESSWNLVLGHCSLAAWPPLLAVLSWFLTCRVSFGGLRTPGAAPPPSHLLKARTKHGTAGKALSIPRQGTEPTSGSSSLHLISSPDCLETWSPTFGHQGPALL